jgi:AraC-like DNA-binding protein
MKIQIFFMIALQYLITWVIITMPVVIHFSDKRIGLAAFKKYEHSTLSSEEARLIAGKLNAHMEKSRPYQNPLYSVQDLSRDVQISYLEVAETLNGLLGQSFNDYINNYRIEEVKRLFKDPEYKKASILSIAFESGFNSKAAFYSSFKKFTGETPTQCRNRLHTDN